MTRASASFSVRPVALTWYSMAVASHWPVSSWATSTSNFMLVSVALRKCRVAGRCVGDRVVVLGGDGAADTDGADDVAVLHDRHAALAEDEAIVAERGHVVGEEHALAEALLEVERGGLKASRGVGHHARPRGALQQAHALRRRSEEHTSELQSRSD